MFSRYFIPVFLLCGISLQFVSATFEDDITCYLQNIPEDGRLQFCELAEKYGYNCVRYNVTTSDGYILGVFNIPGNRKYPVYLQHGLVDSSDTFLIRGKTSLAVYLADKGYDVWLGNMRGNKHSRAHVTLDPDSLLDQKFWKFSFHESAIHDLPAIIDFILQTTEQNQLQAIGHSQGTTLFYVLGSMRPEYNDKIKIFISLAPVAFLHHSRGIISLGNLLPVPGLSAALSVLGHGEFLRNSSHLVAFIRKICSAGTVGYIVCAEGFAFPFAGRDPEYLEPEFFPIAIGHYPSGASMQNVVHLAQIASRRRFGQYDYGLVKNLFVYNRPKPPDYPLRKCSMKHAIFGGANDYLSDLDDVELVRKRLPNVVYYHEMARKEWNHIDFVWGKYMYRDLFGLIQQVLNKYY